VAEDTALPLSIEVPGIDIWAEPKSFHIRAASSTASAAGAGAASVKASPSVSGGHHQRRGRGGGGGRGWYRQPDVRYLTVGKQAYRFLRPGHNHFFCAALDWRSGARGLAYFTLHKV